MERRLACIGVMALAACSSPAMPPSIGTDIGLDVLPLSDVVIDTGVDVPPVDTGTVTGGIPSCPDPTERGCGSVAISGGSFTLSGDVSANNPDLGYSLSQPITVSAFDLDAYEVTVARFRRFWAAGHPAATSLLTYPLTGAVVSIDAMGCQTEIARTIRAMGGHYVLAVKENQPTLHTVVIEQFDEAASGTSVRTAVALDDTQGNGRVGVRRIVTTAAPDLPEIDRWSGLKSFILVESERRKRDKVSYEKRYYITDLPHEDATGLGAYVRDHWSVENQLHWQLDVAFREDATMVSKGHGPENLSLLNKMALTMITRVPGRKNGVAVSRKRAGWDDEFLLQILAHGMTG